MKLCKSNISVAFCLTLWNYADNEWHLQGPAAQSLDHAPKHSRSADEDRTRALTSCISVKMWTKGKNWSQLQTKDRTE